MLLTDGPVFVCQGPGDRLVGESAKVRCARFPGPHPAGLAGAHSHRLLPLRLGRCVWQVDALILARDCPGLRAVKTGRFAHWLIG